VTTGDQLGPYLIHERLGAGGMGVVYRATDTRLNRVVAIKALAPEALADPVRRLRFIQEARAASALDHPHIVTVYDIVEEAGQSSIVMQYVAGQTLAGLLRDGPLPLDLCLRYAVQIADALACAHKSGIIHRDLKPANVMITAGGQVKVLDFGLAKLAEADPGGPERETLTAGPRTEEGRILGTAAYMSPEQAQGKKLDGRSDIFSLGALLYEMATGQRAFRGEDRVSILAAIVLGEPEPISTLAPSLPAELGRVISRALRKDPNRRWQTMADLRVAIEDLREEPRSGVTRAVPASRLRRRWLPLMIAGIAAVGAVAVYRLLVTPRVPQSAPIQAAPLTSNLGREEFPAFSPDGRQLAYAWASETQKQYDIYVKLVGAGEPLRLTSDPADEHSPAWSPDSQYVAFFRAGKPGGLFVVPSLGGAERRVAPRHGNGLGVAWTRDGRSIAICDRDREREPLGVFLVSVASGAKRRITDPPPSEIGDRYLAISRDGARLAISRFRTARTADLWIANLGPDGVPNAPPKRITFEERFITGLAWSHNDREIVFSSNRSGFQRLYRIPASGGEPQPLFAGSDNARYPSISGTRLAYVAIAHDVDIWRTAPPVGSRFEEGTRWIASKRLDASPSYSPDGRRIAFISSRTGTHELWIADAEGAGPIQLTAIGASQMDMPAWSPDGGSIAVTALHQGAGLYVVSTEGGAHRRLATQISSILFPSWSRDGRWIYFSAPRQGQSALWKVAREGGAPVLITDAVIQAIESPDGDSLYLVKPDRSGIWKRALPHGPETLLYKGSIPTRWAMTHKRLFLFESHPDRQQLQVADLPPGTLRRAVTVPDIRLEVSPAALAISPDGRWILYAREIRNDMSIMIAENHR